LQAISWLEGAGAVYAENQVLRFIADLAGLPPEAGGCFVAGGSAGNLSALVVARDAAKRTATAAPPRWRVAVSDQTHSSVANALRIMDVDPLIVATDDERLTGKTLQAALDADGDPASVFAVVATAGTTNAGIVDDLEGVSAVASRSGMWLHVDAAYGGAALLAPSARHRFRGIEHADSLVVDPHKWLYAPFDCAALLYREPQLARSVHTQEASYLDVIHERPAEWNPSDYAFHLTRRARGLPLWFSLAVHGSNAYRDAIETVLTTAHAAAARIAATPNLELIRDPELSIVLFRRVGWAPDDYQRWSDDLLTTQTAFVTPSSWHGETVARLAFLHPATSLELVDEILATMA
jgi:glutamate/tyrosine decarboxylase-like PLP-dependent enzyme